MIFRFVNVMYFFFQAEDGIRDHCVTGVQTCALPIFVCNTDDKYIDPHCKSQHCFLGDIKYDFIGRMENLSHDLEYIKNRLNLSLELPKVNKTDYSTSSDINNNYSTLSPSELRSLKTGFPSYKNLYTPELIDLVAQRYAKDLEMFGYEFV